MNVFVLDNYDSFTWNLVQYLGELGAEVRVVRNDELELPALDGEPPDAVVISPGPGAPPDAGASVPLVGWCAERRTPLLGVCLGHQAIGEAFGARVVRAPSIVHGKTSMMTHSDVGVLRGLPDPFEAMRYHSLVIDESSLPEALEATAWTTDGVVMAVRHTELPIEGVQFHPESILTVRGIDLLRTFLENAGLEGAAVSSRRR